MKKKVLDLYNKLSPLFTVTGFLSNCEKKKKKICVLILVMYQFLMRQSLTTIRLKVDGINGVGETVNFTPTWLDILEGPWTLVWYGLCMSTAQRDGDCHQMRWSSTWSDYGGRREENKKSLGSTNKKI